MIPSLPRSATAFLTAPSGRRIPLIEGAAFVLGRGSECNLTLEDSSCSRRHAEIAERKATWCLVDLSSTNGTFLNGRKVRKTAELSQGDRIRCGSTFLLFHEREPEFTFSLGGVEEEGDKTVTLRPEPGASILTGSLEAIALVELLQVLLQARLDGRLVFKFPDGGGAVELREGEIRSAEYLSVSGLPALFAMALRGKRGTFSLEQGGALPDVGMRLDVQQAMFQLCRVLDEFESDEYSEQRS